MVEFLIILFFIVIVVIALGAAGKTPAEGTGYKGATKDDPERLYKWLWGYGGKQNMTYQIKRRNARKLTKGIFKRLTR